MEEPSQPMDQSTGIFSENWQERDENVRDLHREMVPGGRDRSLSLGKIDLSDQRIEPGITSSDFARPGGFRRQYLGKEDTVFVADPTNEELSDQTVLLFSAIAADEKAGVEDDNLPTRLASKRMTTLTIFKSFVATGILFLPKGFAAAGLVCASITMLTCGALSIYAMLILLKTRDFVLRSRVAAATVSARSDSTEKTTGASNCESQEAVAMMHHRTPLLGAHSNEGKPQVLKVGSYSDIGRAVLGTPGAFAVNASIVLSQLGFCCVYIAFVGNIVSSTLDAYDAFGENKIPWPKWSYELLIAPVLIPLVWIRHLKYFAVPNLIADVVLVVSLLYICIQAAANASSVGVYANWRGVCHSRDDAERYGCLYFNSLTFASFLGTAVYTFEGIAMVLPIRNSMLEPEALPSLLKRCMGALTLLLAFFGALNYGVYGANTTPIIIDSLPLEGRTAVGVAFVLMAVGMYPLMLFPVRSRACSGTY